MATQGKDEHGSPPAGREKRGMSPSYPWHKRSLSPNDQKHVSITQTPSPSPSDQKRVPNYMRPIQSSAPHTSIPAKTKQTSATQNQKPATLNRRRSFDKPPSPNSRLHKTQTTTTTTTTTPTDQKTNLQSSSYLLVPKRSSSFSPSSSSLPQKKNSRKSHSLYARPTAMTTSVKKNSPAMSKEQNNRSTSATASSKASSTTSSPEDHIVDTNECQLQENLGLSPVTDQESNNIELPVDDVPVPEDENLKDLEEHDVMIHDDAEQEKNQHKDLKSSTVSDEDQNQILHVQMEEAEAELVSAPIDQTNKDESNISHPEAESFAGQSLIEGHEEKVEGNHATKNSTENKYLDEKKEEQVDRGGISQTKPNEGEAADHQGTGNLTKPEKGKGKEYSQAQGKAYNDVIEETASKLIGEKRKNKVLALAGAFETVISLQNQHPPEGT